MRKKRRIAALHAMNSPQKNRQIFNNIQFSNSLKLNPLR